MVSLMQRRREMMFARKQARLPAEYQEVEYIENLANTGAYISTGFTPNQNTRVKGKTYRNGMFLDRQGVDSRSFSVQYAKFTGDKYSWRAEYGSKYMPPSASSFNVQPDRGSPVTYDFNKNNFSYENEDGVSWSGTTNAQTFTCPSVLYIGRMYNGSAATTAVVGRVYFFKIWDNGTLIRDYVPCYRKADSKPGLYDLVNSSFNPATGDFGSDFTVGPNV